MFWFLTKSGQPLIRKNRFNRLVQNLNMIDSIERLKIFVFERSSQFLIFRSNK